MGRGARGVGVELLDAPGIAGPELGASLEHVADATTRLGGLGPLARALARVPTSDGTLRLLDVGAGNGRVAAMLARILERRGRSVRWVCSDLAPGALDHVLCPQTPRVACDARALPFADDSFDAAVSVLTLHHFDPRDACAVLAEMARVARGPVIVSDLRRSVGGSWGARLLAETVWRRNRFTRHDAPLSASKAYTDGEAGTLAREAGLSRVRVRRHFPFRFVLVARP